MSECYCGQKFLDPEDYRDHLPCPATAHLQEPRNTGDALDYWQERAEKSEARVAELEAINQRLRAEAESRESDLTIARQIASESGRYRARVAELELTLRQIRRWESTDG